MFSLVESPTEDNLVTSLNLALFWYSQGEWQRMMVYEANAGSTSRILGLDNLPATSNTSISIELSRRRFWAYYILNQFVDRTASQKTRISGLEAVPLPCDEVRFESGALPAQHITLDSQERNTSLYAELIRISSTW